MKLIKVIVLLLFSIYTFRAFSQGKVINIYKSDSSTILVEAKFTKGTNKNKRVSIIKLEIVKFDEKFGTLKINSIEEFIDKKHLTYKYKIKTN
jgi:hypothetical protein